MSTALQPEAAALPEEAPSLLVEARGAVRVVTLNRPAALNAIDVGLHVALGRVWDRLAADPGARAVVLTGAGRAFSAGGDLAHIQAMQADPDLRRAEMDLAATLVRRMLACPLPVVAAVNGPAVGLGATLTVLSDLVLIADDAYLADPHVPVGLTAADGGVSLWPAHLGLHRAKEYLLLGDRIPAAVAVELGLANRAVPGDELLDEALALAGRLAAQPAHAVRTTKESLNAHLAHAVGDLLDRALDAEFASFDDAEHRAAVARLLAPRG